MRARNWSTRDCLHGDFELPATLPLKGWLKYIGDHRECDAEHEKAKKKAHGLNSAFCCQYDCLRDLNTGVESKRLP